MQPNRKVTLTDSQSEVIPASPELLRTFFSNAITNLIKHTPESAQVELSIKQHHESLEILIDDAGPGIPDLKKNGTQSKFKRFDASRSHSSGGSGLGLSIMQKIVELHGGRMVLSKSGLGGLRILGTLSKN
jgi:two-component system sensor histidine kinase CpxA